MPLQYDDIPGSWGTYSADWPSIEYTKDEADRAYVACSIEQVVPYGSYVKMGNVIRLETPELRQKLIDHIAASPLKTAEAVLANRKKDLT